MAGISARAAFDNNRSAVMTYALNRTAEFVADPASRRTLVVEADLSLAQSKQAALAHIDQKLGGKRVGALVGGPPCQGFSHAGFRDPSDSRSDLAVTFMDFVDALAPDFVVLENVEGILSAQKGRIARELIGTLRELGLRIEEPWVLAAEQYGVPQMRRRVFFVAARDRLVPPPSPNFDRCMGRREPEDQARGNTYPVTAGEALLDLPALVGARVTNAPSSYARWARGCLSPVDLLAKRERQ
jgi:site-specific DNA-cytosine methylase